MHNIEMHEVSDAFAVCWQAAGRHLQAQMQGAGNWIKAKLDPPFLEHLSFRLGNQLFFVRIEDVEGRLRVPGSRSGLLSVAEGCAGHSCLMPMRFRAGVWMPDITGWGLLNACTLGERIDPFTLVTDERIEMTEWELQDFAVQIVREHIAKNGQKLISWQGNPSVHPSIWFAGSGGREWVIVRAARYPILAALPPSDWPYILEQFASAGTTGHFASVSVANAEDAFDTKGVIPAEPLWRGHGMIVRFQGLTAASDVSLRGF